MIKSSQTRRQFAKTATGLVVGSATPYFFSSRSLQAQGSKSKNDRLRLGLIGAGGMGVGNMFVAREWGDIVAIADVDSNHTESASKKLSNGKAQTYSDYREILQRDDLDALHIGTPDHWHTKILIEALLAGHDVYCEKPLTFDYGEGKLIRQVMARTNQIVQVGTQQRSTFDLFTKAIAIVAEGRIGKIKRIQTSLGGGFESPAVPVADVPKNLDWERWIGPAPMVDYRFAKVKNENRKEKDPEFNTYTNAHFDFRWWYDFSVGKLTDWGAHHVDIAMWALEANGQSTTPLSVGGKAKHPVPFKDGYPTVPDRFNTALSFNLTVRLEDGVKLIIRDDADNGVLIDGTKGRIFVNRGRLVGKPVEDLADNPLSEGAVQKVYKGMPMEFNERKAHWANFFDCCKTRKSPISDVESHIRSLNICHLAAISARLGRTIRWDAEAEQIKRDEQANAFLSRPYREGYAIEM